ncbi:MAG: serine/threonine-protein phosphatase [Hamadaea sp.]|nr:serine/threonine-protein phosphatase [Hamadaea sp.]NUR47408.1 serine/threonine-protein phosphatase [Hamadaea sp.]NUT03539.1 serine/threonine-protein phosphatase [Hamadaea sp.]
MLESRAEQWHAAIVDLLKEVNLSQPDELPHLVRAVTAQLAKDVRIYLVDYEQETLRELTATATGDEQPVQHSTAGEAYRVGKVVADPSDPGLLWVPLVDSTERLGVLRVAAEPESGVFEGEEPDIQFAHLLGHLVAAKMPYGDRLHRVRSSQAMTMASVLLRQLLPPSTFTSDRLVLAAAMQPAYAVGGDCFDYAVDGDLARIVVLDGAGHGMTAGLSVAVALSAIRAARRNGGGFGEMTEQADAQLAEEFTNSQYVTGVLADLNLVTGVLRYVSCGHPEPVVLPASGGAVPLTAARRPPLGIPDQVEPAEHQLFPGDRLLLYTDGIVESRAADGTLFGVERLVGTAQELIAAGQTSPEIARLLTRAVMEHHHGPPADDATVLLVEWSTTAAEKALP